MNEGNILVGVLLTVFLGAVMGLAAIAYAPDTESGRIHSCVKNGTMQYVDGDCIPIND